MAKSKITKKVILKIFYNYSRPITLKDIYKKLSPSRKEKTKIQQILASLEKDGEIIPIRYGRAYGLVKRMELVKGEIELHSDGYGFLIPDDKRRKDVYISKENLKDAWHKDKVVVALLPDSRGKSPEGRVVRVIKKSIEDIPAHLIRKLSENIFLARPCDTKLPFDFIVDISEVKDNFVDTNQVALIRPTEFYEKNVFFAKAIKILGGADKISVQEEIVKIFHSIPREFPQEALFEAEKINLKITEKDLAERKDLRHLDFVTIDGKNARDFDDAIFVDQVGSGFKLYVAIADVTHYVKRGSALDLEARERGNSYYFPTSVEPMFPPKLSNYICSLNPGEDRLAIVVEMDFNKMGEMKRATFYGAVIKSKKRLTYSQVQEAIIEKDVDERKKIGHNICNMLDIAKNLAELLYERKSNRGAIDFDIPEPEVIFQDLDKAELGNFIVKPKKRYFSHQIIEEFMIAANEAVANFLTEMELPCMYRIHPEPDEEKLASLFAILETTEISNKIPEEIDSKTIQKLLEDVKGKDFEFLVNRLVLRSMMQATYDPKNTGHFGLASDCYCHFTSPIRRYADVIVHRILKTYLGLENSRLLKPKKMKTLGEHLSKRERIALNAERDILKRLTVLIMKDRIGDRFTGIISSVMDFGFFVEIKEAMAEGLVRLSSLIDDYYIYDHTYQRLVGKRSGKIYQIGDQVDVKVVNVNLDKMEIDFELCDVSLEEEINE